MAADPDVRFDFDQALDWQPLECTAVASPKLSVDVRARPPLDIVKDLACALARQAAREDAAAELAKERAASCELPSTPVSVPTSKTSDPS
jgi:hypothetical protein